MENKANNEAILSFGSNVKAQYVSDAIEWIGSRTECRKVSGIYETPEIHGAPKPYANAVMQILTPMSIDELNRLLKSYELQCGRNDVARQRGEVPIDVDVVIWNGDVVRPRDFRQSFFKIGYSQIAVSLLE